MRSYCYRLLCSVILLAACGSVRAGAQVSFNVYDIDSSDFPRMRARLIAVDERGEMMQGLAPGDFRITENGIERQVLSVSCATRKVPSPLSSVLTVDGSSSMMEERRDRIARNAAIAWINALPLGYSECAVTSFNKYSYLNQDFTTDRTLLLRGVNSIRFRFDTNFDTALIGERGGGLSVAIGGRHRRIVVILSDGKGSGGEDAIVDLAVRHNIAVYCIALTYECSDLLKNIATRTGGAWFEKVATEADAVKIYLKILKDVQQGEPCTIEWMSAPGCDISRDLAVELPAKGLADTVRYRLPGSGLIRLEIMPASLMYGAVAPGGELTKEVVLMASGSPITVLGIASSDGRFTIEEGGAPPAFTLQPGETRLVKVRFRPTDESYYITAQLDFQTDVCSGQFLPLIARRPEPGKLRLLRPNGGEQLVAGELATVEWSGVSPTIPMRLDYSIDEGASWLPVADGAVGMRHEWRIPNTPSRRCLMRAGTTRGEAITTPLLVLHLDAPDVSSVMFGPGGQNVAAGQADPGAVYIWNAQTGDMLNRLTNGSQKLLAAIYDSPGDRFLMIDSLMAPRLIDAYTGASIINFTFSGFQSWAGGGYANDRKHIGTITENVAALWTISDGVLAARLRHDHPLTSIAFNNAGTRLMTGGITGRVEIWNAADWSRIGGWSAHDGIIHAVAFNPVNATIVTAGEDGLVKIWSQTGTLLRTLAGHIGPVYAAAFSPDGASILTGGADRTARLWEIASGLDLRNFIGHTERVRAVAWNHDGSRIATGGGDGTVRIWEIGERIGGEDLSDALWAILAPRGAARDVEMGTAAMGGYKDSVVTGWLCNTGDLPLDVREIVFEGDDRADFTILSDPPPFVIPPDSCIAIEFRFRPGGIGNRLAVIAILTPLDTIRQNIRGRGVDSRLEVVAQQIDFGDVPLGDRRELMVQAVVRNKGTTPLHVNRTALGGGDTSRFDILSGGGPFTLGPGETRRMHLRFTPGRRGVARTAILFGFDEDGSPARAHLQGRGICDVVGGSHGIRLGEVAGEVAPGVIVEIPVVLYNRHRLPPDGGAYTMSLKLNRRLLHPLDSDAVAVELDGEVIIGYGGRWEGNGDTLRTLTFLAALGDADHTQVRLASFGWDWECPVQIKREENSTVRITVCREGESTRLFLDDYDLFLKSLHPNPASREVKMELATAAGGHVRFYLVDMLGRNAGTLIDREFIPGTHQLSLDLGEIPPGHYLYIVESGPARRSGVMEVVR